MAALSIVPRAIPERPKTYRFSLIKNASSSNWSSHDGYGGYTIEADSAVDALLLHDGPEHMDAVGIAVSLNPDSAYIPLSGDRELWAELVPNEEE